MSKSERYSAHMARRSLIQLLVITLSVMTPSFPAHAATKVGSPCQRSGQVVKVKGAYLRCGKSGAKFVWRPFLKPTPTPTATPIASDEVGRRIEALLATIDAKASAAPFDIHWVREPGDDGIFPTLLEESLSRAINFFTAVDMLPKIKDLYLFSGRSQQWFSSTALEYCPNFQAPQRGGTATLCSPDKAAIRINLAGIVTGDYENVDAAAKLSEYPLNLQVNSWGCTTSTGRKCVSYPRWLNIHATIPHELFHVYQMKQTSWNRLPSWLLEGSAVAIQQMSDVLQMRPRSQYETHVRQVLLGYRGGEAEASKCLQGLSLISSVVGKGCQYPQGAQAVETLLALHGGLEALKTLLSAELTTDFASDFEKAVGISFAQFAREADAHSRIFGYASGTK